MKIFKQLGEAMEALSEALRQHRVAIRNNPCDNCVCSPSTFMLRKELVIGLDESPFKCETCDKLKHPAFEKWPNGSKVMAGPHDEREIGRVVSWQGKFHPYLRTDEGYFRKEAKDHHDLALETLIW